MPLSFSPYKPKNYLVDEQDFDFLNTAAAPEGDISPDTPLGSNASTMATLMSTPPPLNLKSDKLRAMEEMPDRPIPGRPKWWQRLAAGAVGGFAGYVNAAGRTRIDPTAAIEGIYAGNTPYEQAKWDQDYQRKAREAQIEQRQNQQAIAGYNAESGYRRTLADEQAKASTVALNTTRADLARKGTFNPVGNGSAINSVTGETRSIAPPPPAFARPGVGVRQSDGTYKVEVPLPDKTDPLIEDKRKKLQADTKRAEAQAAKAGRDGGGKKHDDPYGQVKKEKDAAYLQAEKDFDGERTRVESEYKKRIDEAAKNKRTEEVKTLTAERDKRLQEVFKNHNRRKNAIERDAQVRRNQLGLSDLPLPPGDFDESTGDYKMGKSDPLGIR